MSPSSKEQGSLPNNLSSASKKLNTPSFKNTINKRESFGNKVDRKLSISGKLDLENPDLVTDFQRLSKIPEVLDESNVLSEATNEMRKSNRYSSQYQTLNTVHDVGSSSDNKMNSYYSKKSPEKSSERIASAFDNFMNQKHSEQNLPIFGDAE